jgi:hypothetical protein
VSEQPTRLRRKGPLTCVGELLIDGHANCIEELGALVITYGRINAFFAGLKRGTASVKPEKSARRLGDEYNEVDKIIGGAFEHASAAFLAAEWPKLRRDIWQENQATLVQAVTIMDRNTRRFATRSGSPGPLERSVGSVGDSYDNASPRPSTVSTRRRSSDGAGRGAASTTSRTDAGLGRLVQQPPSARAARLRRTINHTVRR